MTVVMEGYMKKEVQELILSTILTVLIYYTGMNIIPLLIILLPLNFIVLGIRRNLAYSIISMMISFVFIYILGGLASVMMVGFLSLLTFPMVIAVKKGMGSTQSILISTAFFIILNIIILALASSQFEEGIFVELEKILNEGASEQLDLLEESTQLTELELDFNEIRNQTKDLISIFIVAFPAILVVYSFIISLVNYYVSAPLVNSASEEDKMERFRFFTLPSNFNMGVFYSLIAVIILGLFDFAYQEELFLNLGVILIALYTIQGISVVMDILGSRSGALAVILVVVLLTANLSFILTVLGLLEIIFSLRLRWRQRNE